MHGSRTRDEAGITLVELLVVMILLGVVGSIATTAVVSSLRSATASTNRVLALNELETGLQRIVRDLRSATIIEPPTGGQDPEEYVTMTVYRDGNFHDVTYELEGGQLIRSETGQVLVAVIDNEAMDVPMFRYYDRFGVEIPDCATNCSGAATVKVQLVRGIDGRSPVVVETEAAIRNLRYRSS